MESVYPEVAELALILSSSLYLRSAKARFPLQTPYLNSVEEEEKLPTTQMFGWLVASLNLEKTFHQTSHKQYVQFWPA